MHFLYCHYKVHILYVKKPAKTLHNNKPLGHLSNVDRHRALGMVEGGLLYRQVEEGMGCSHPTIARLVEMHNATGSVDDRQRPGRERVIHVSRTGTLF